MKFGDSSGDLSFRLQPLFQQSSGRRDAARVIYASAGSQQVYTYMRNGVKEDILLSQAPGDTAQYAWRLGLGSKLTARMLPDGSVGIYSADPTLYGNLQISDAKSRKLVDAARARGDKSALKYVLPKPYIKSLDSKKQYGDVSFKLDGDILTLEAHNLLSKTYPLSIDPSVVVTTTADFRSGFDDGMIDYSTAGQIGRSNISLGTVPSWATNTNPFATGRYSHAAVAYNGYLYVIGGIHGVSDTACKL